VALVAAFFAGGALIAAATLTGRPVLAGQGQPPAGGRKPV
jgi:hypothetical protein